MDSRSSSREFGHWETCLNIEKVIDSEEARKNAGAFMPLPEKGVADEIKKVSNWLHSLGKTKYMFLTPELALIDGLAAISDNDPEMIITVPCDMEPDMLERLENNLPKSVKTTLLMEPFTRLDFYPSDSVIVICGYLGGGRPMVMHDTYRMAEHYGSFYGKIIFIPFVILDSAVRYSGWRELSQNGNITIWRDDV